MNNISHPNTHRQYPIRLDIRILIKLIDNGTVIDSIGRIWTNNNGKRICSTKRVQPKSYIIVCLYMLFYVQSIQIKYV